MPPLSPAIATPAGYAPAFALGFADSGGKFRLVDQSQPLPVSLAAATTSTTAPKALSGTAQAAGSAGPYAMVAGRTAILTLSGTWQGTVRLERSTDGGATRQPLTAGGQPWAQFSRNACEAVWEEPEDGATLYLAFTITSGTLAYRLAQ